ncbi:Uncharacterised protein [Segatella copri]|nr:Uncharacterised protein [Segatella copri]
MRTGTSTRVTTQANHIAGSYLFALSNELLREVTIDGLQTIVVTNHDVLTVTTTFISYDANSA